MQVSPLLIIIVGLIVRFGTSMHTLGDVLIGVGVGLTILVTLLMIFVLGFMKNLTKKGRF